MAGNTAKYVIVPEENWRAVKPERYILSETARHRRKVVERIELALAGFLGVGIYVLTGLALRWLGVE